METIKQFYAAPGTFVVLFRSKLLWLEVYMMYAAYLSTRAPPSYLSGVYHFQQVADSDHPLSALGGGLSALLAKDCKGTVRVFRTEFTLEGAIRIYGC